MALNSKQQLAYSKIQDGHNVYIGGPGGVGKSYLINHIMSVYGDVAVLVAPTGIAALNINGSTINSIFKLPFHVLTEQDFVVRQKVADIFSKTSPVRMLIIDELSMVRLDKLYAMDQILRKVRMNNAPFGGIQVIGVGDFFQITPVISNDEKQFYFSQYKSEFAFGDQLWLFSNFQYIELSEVVRQTDEEFIYHLQQIRVKSKHYKDAVDFFNAKSKLNYNKVIELGPLLLCTTNATTDSYNKKNYALLSDKEYTFTGMIKGAYNPKDAPSPIDLKLKLYTKVIFTANSPSYKNGQTGFVYEINDKYITVLLEDSEEVVRVEPYVWRVMDTSVVDGKVIRVEIGSYAQYPLKHGWAVTVHKVQGVTLSNGMLDFGQGCFTYGQAYVALSRIKCVDSFTMASPMNYSDVIVSEQVRKFYDNNCVGFVD